MQEKRHILDLVQIQLEKKRLKLYEIFCHFSRTLSIEAKKQEVDGLKVSSGVGIGLRVLIDERVGFSYTTDTGPSSVSSLVENAIASAKISDPDPAYDFATKPKETNKVCKIFDSDFEAHGQEEKVDQALELERAAMEKDSAIRQVRRATYAESESEILIRNSKGLDSGYRSTVNSAVIMVKAEKNGNAETGWDYEFSHFYQGLNVKEVGERAAQKALQKLGGKAVSTQRSPIILSEETMTELLDVLAPSFHGDNVKKGKSLLAERLGERILPENINLYDDGLYPTGLATAPFDAEGIPSQKTTLVKNGELRNFLFDLYWGNRAGMPSTGNAARGSYKSPPDIGNSNLYLKGNKSVPVETMVGSLKKGLFVHELIGVHTANPISGEFSLGATGLWVENGEIQFPVKGITISGNILEMFNRVELVGDRIRFFGSTGAPAVLVNDIQISGT